MLEFRVFHHNNRVTNAKDNEDHDHDGHNDDSESTIPKYMQSI